MKKFVLMSFVCAAMMFAACVTDNTKPAEPAADDTTKVEATAENAVVDDSSKVATENAEAPEVEAPAKEEASAEAK